MAIADHIIRVVGTNPQLKRTLIAQAGRDPDGDVKQIIQKATGIKNESSYLPLVTVCRIIAANSPATGDFAGHNPKALPTGRVLLDWSSENGTHKQTLASLTRCVSMDLNYSRNHIERILNHLISAGYRLNFNSIFGDLCHWDDKPAMPRIRWVTSFARLNDEEDDATEDS